jgi:hypothetical protein
MGKAFKLYIILVSVCILTVLMFVSTSHSLTSQPPIDTSRFVEGTIGWGPRRADPARAYDTGSGQLIFNVYETLIAWNRENYGDFVPALATNVPARVETSFIAGNTSEVGSDPTNSTWTNGLTCVGFNDCNSLTSGLSQGDVLYMFDGAAYRSWFVQSLAFAGGTYELTLWRGIYPFHIHTSPVINFVNETGATVDVFDLDDAVYSLQRGLVQDQTGSPQWMFTRRCLVR